MKDSTLAIKRSRPAQMARVLDLNIEGTWRPEEFAAILQHQMNAPFRVELSSLGPELEPKLRVLLEAEGLVLKSYRDLLLHPHPPVELLRLVKDFAKANRHLPHSHLPVEVATVLYYVSIAGALVRCNERITQLSDHELIAGIDWVLAQPWVDPDTKELVAEGRKTLETNIKPDC